MLKKKEKNLCVRGKMETEAECPLIIREIAQGASEYFEYATEYGVFENDEDDQVEELLLRLYRAGCYKEAVCLLRLVFSIAKFDAACAMMSLIHDEHEERREEFFIREFMY